VSFTVVYILQQLPYLNNSSGIRNVSFKCMFYSNYKYWRDDDDDGN
jgi:hypothetical protein